MEVASTTETSVKFYQTKRRNNPKDSHLLGAYIFKIIPGLLGALSLIEIYQFSQKPRTETIIE
jgi:hypothetical protein